MKTKPTKPKKKAAEERRAKPAFECSALLAALVRFHNKHRKSGWAYKLVMHFDGSGRVVEEMGRDTRMFHNAKGLERILRS